ncbi:MAG: acyltransferase, partial [Sphingomonadales bacterium]|nr:acyltransferase [Sphingomonadales bacterium]
IGTEVLFYVVFPLLYPALEAAWQRWGNRALVVAWVAALAIVLGWQTGYHSLYGAWLPNNSFAYGSFVNQLPVFVAGMSWYLAAWRGGGMLPRPGRDVPLAVLLFGICALTLGLELAPFFGLIPSFAALGAVLLGNLLRMSGGEGGWLSALGKVSYSLYIVHFALVWRPSAWLLHSVADVPHAQAMLLVPLYVVEVLLLYPLARIMWRFVEQPANKLGQRLIDSMEKSKESAATAPM